MTKAKIERIANDLGWSVYWEKYSNGVKSVLFRKYSPAGQDFNMEIYYKNLDELASKIDDYYESFDPSQEAYYWLGSDGHGKNGAPDTMGEVYDDMVSCEEMIRDLYDALVA